MTTTIDWARVQQQMRTSIQRYGMDAYQEACLRVLKRQAKGAAYAEADIVRLLPLIMYGVHVDARRSNQARKRREERYATKQPALAESTEDLVLAKEAVISGLQ